jgi:hypothetical protein
MRENDERIEADQPVDGEMGLPGQEIGDGRG